MIKSLEKTEAVETEIKKFFENIENITSCVDIYGMLVEDQVTE